MTMYTIRALVWKEGLRGQYMAETLVGDYNVWMNSRGRYIWADDIFHEAPTLEAAKAAAEAHYRERILTALEVVG